MKALFIITHALYGAQTHTRQSSEMIEWLSVNELSILVTTSPRGVTRVCFISCAVMATGNTGWITNQLICLFQLCGLMSKPPLPGYHTNQYYGKMCLAHFLASVGINPPPPPPNFKTDHKAAMLPQAKSFDYFDYLKDLTPIHTSIYIKESYMPVFMCCDGYR